MSILESALSRSSITLFLRCDRDGLIMSCSPALTEALGLAQAEAVGQFLWQWLSESQAECLRARLQGAGSLSILGLFDPESDFQVAVDRDGFFLLGDQPADLAQHQMEKQAARMRAEFLANLSHAVRAPLNVVTGTLHLLSQTALNQQQCDYLRDLESGAASLRAVVAEILDFSDGDVTRLELRPVSFRLHSLVEGVLVQLGGQAAEKAVELVSQIAADVPATLWGDPLRLGQLLLALLENGVKFAAGGRVSLRVEMMEPGRLQFKILDSGIGMTAEQLTGFLGSFAPVQAGLGFPLSRRLVERMGGTIRVESQAGQGTLVTLELPFGPVAEATMAVRRGGPGQKVLLVEDSEVNQRIVVGLLEQAGVTVEVAGNGRVAVEKALECGPEIPWKLILMDLQMPEMDGYAATRRIRQLSCFDSLPILAMSSHVLGEERDRCREVGMDDFVFKPVDPESWFSVLSQWLPLQTALESASMPRLTQVNSAAGLRACGGNHRFYRDLLLDFGERCERSAWELEAAVRAGDLIRVKFLSHTLHGVAANLGAEELARRCTLVEEKARLDSPGELHGEATLLADHLCLLARTLPVELAVASGAQEPVEVKEWTAERVQATRAAMAALGGHLEKGLGDSLDSVQDLISVAAPMAPQLTRLERLVNQFDFSAALQELQDLRAKVPAEFLVAARRV